MEGGGECPGDRLMQNRQGPANMSLTASSLIHTFSISTRDFIHHTTQRFHLNREVFTITSQECKSAPVALTAVSLSGQIRNRTRYSMKIQSTSDNLIRSKFSAQLMFGRNDEVERRKDVEFLIGFPFFGSHTTNVESQTVKRSNRGGGRRQFLSWVVHTQLHHWTKWNTQLII